MEDCVHGNIEERGGGALGSTPINFLMVMNQGQEDTGSCNGISISAISVLLSRK